ncbi:MAG: PIN domain-containing protein [Bacillota bacterium]|jgi:predicted nucleic acid-binding protein|nr:PIN domain-containing protein [Thermoanaerobacteraceae bacterium]
MTGKVLVDTNLLVYAYDFADPAKQETAFRLLDELATSGRGVLSAQVLTEFVVAVTRKIAKPLDLKTVQKSVENYLSSWVVLDVTGFVVLEAVRGVREHRFSYWDAQIWATARLNQIPVVLSEDFASGSTVEGVTFLNPFTADFDLTRFL